MIERCANCNAILSFKDGFTVCKACGTCYNTESVSNLSKSKVTNDRYIHLKDFTLAEFFSIVKRPDDILEKEWNEVISTCNRIEIEKKRHQYSIIVGIVSHLLYKISIRERRLESWKYSVIYWMDIFSQPYKKTKAYVYHFDIKKI